MNKLLQWYRLAISMGMEYIFFRIFFEFKRKTGLLKLAYPVNPKFKTWIPLSKWKTTAPNFFFTSRSDFETLPTPSSQLLQSAQRILSGEVQFFQSEWKKIAQHDWVTNPVNGFQYDVKKHWTDIPDFHPTFGDIKYVWERSRFSFLQTILRYDAHTGLDSSEWLFSQIESWIENNPINQGPNYRCSQEISLRVFNWTLALYFYRNSSHLTESRFQKIIFVIYWQLRHVRSNIQFSRIAVRNNHAITETLSLYTAGLLFPFFKEANSWRVLGKKWFEKEIAYQIYEDGAYLQFSFNYHRVVIQLLTWAISLSSKHDEKFSSVVYERAEASLKLLLHCQDGFSGGLPNYGANDGSLFFKWNDENFRNFKPSIDTLHFLLTSESVYFHSPLYEDNLWFGNNRSLKLFQKLVVKNGFYSFPKGGLHVYRNTSTVFFINCVNYINRPSQADALHLDVWHDGKNLLRDAGSYQYNGDEQILKYFFGTESHNTVMLNTSDQMLKGPRFVWFNWTRVVKAEWSENDATIIFSGAASVYKHLGRITHRRTIVIDKKAFQLEIIDQIDGIQGQLVRQLWHTDPLEIMKLKFTTSNLESRHESLRYFSNSYGVLESIEQLEFHTKSNSISTQITLL